MKIAEHTDGEQPKPESLRADVNNPDDLDRVLYPADAVRVQAFLAAHVPQVAREVVEHSVCMYTMTPDAHFVIDRHPRYANVYLAAGFSGHGFKFCPIIGEVLAEWIVHGRTTAPIGFLSLQRKVLQQKVLQQEALR